MYRLTETEKELHDRHGSVSPPASHVDKSMIEEKHTSFEKLPSSDLSSNVVDLSIIPEITYVLIGSGTASYSAMKVSKNT